MLFCLGDMGVGKSCLLHQFTEKKCMQHNPPEIKIMYSLKSTLWQTEALYTPVSLCIET